MKYLKITNDGIVDPAAFSLIGASTKRNDESKIGMFGSGNKYAIAYLMRNKYDFRVVSNGKEIKFRTIQKSLVGQNFDVITIDHEATSITTEMGHKWELWQAIRELYSNAIDQGFIELNVVDEINIDDLDSNTHVFIELKPDLHDLYINLNDYFAIDKTILFENSVGKIYKKHSAKTCIYRKGILVYQTSKKSMFDYDLNDVDINEDRIAKYHWQIGTGVWKMLYSCNDDYVIRSVISAVEQKDYFENNIDDSFVDSYSDDLSLNWQNAIKTYKIVPKSMSGYVKDNERAQTRFLPVRLYHDLISKFGEKNRPESFKRTKSGNDYTTTQPTTMMLQMLKDVLQWFDDVNFTIEYPVDIVSFHRTNVHGSIHDDTILVDKDAFTQGKDWIASIIIEEYIHIKHNAADETREFQNASIAELLTYMKTQNANIL